MLQALSFLTLAVATTIDRLASGYGWVGLPLDTLVDAVALAVAGAAVGLAGVAFSLPAVGAEFDYH